MTLPHRRVGKNAWSSWRQYPWLGMSRVTDAFVADAAYFHFTDANHIDIWHPQKGSRDLTVDGTAAQFNTSGWNGTPSYLSTSRFRFDAFSADITGTDLPFSFAMEFLPSAIDPTDFLFYANAGTDATKVHRIVFNGTGANFAVSRGDGTTTKTGSTATCSLSNRHVLVHVFDGQNLSTWLDGTQIDNAADLNVNAIAFTHCALSEAFTTGASNIANCAMRSFIWGPYAWTPTEVAAIRSAMRASSGV